MSASTVVAGTGGAVQLPHPKIPAASGFTITVDTYGVEGRGYRPVRIGLSALAASQADRTVTVQFRTGDWNGRNTQLDVGQDIEVPAGATSAAATIAVPQYEPWETVWWDVFVDGDYAVELSAGPSTGPSNNSNWDDSKPRILLVGSGQPAAARFVRLVRNAGLGPAVPREQGRAVAAFTPPPPTGGLTNTPLRNATVAIPGNGSPSVAICDPADLDVRWIDYSQYDIVYVEHEDLQSLAEQRPAAFAAIVDWARLGGSLWVADQEIDEETLESVADMLGINAPGDSPQSRGWRRPRQVSADYTNNGMNSRPTPFLSRAPPAWTRDLQLGQLVVVGEPTNQGDVWLQGLAVGAFFADPDRDLWVRRHGLATEVPSMDFWNFSIPGVGLAPVTEFRVLITLFVIAIGPVNYFLLRRWKRLHLLVVTVPVSAALVTGGLFLYALVSDGLGVQTRVRSYAELDQAQGHAVEWSRQAYYAGLAPSGGLQFDEQTIVLPLLPSSSDPYGYDAQVESTSRELEWGQGQRLSEGWLAARTQTQYVLLRSGASEKRLAVSHDQGAVRVENRLGSRIQQLLLVDEAGGHHWGAGIAAEDSADLADVELDVAARDLRHAAADNAPSMPTEMSGYQGERIFGIRRRYYSSSRSNLSELGLPSLATSRLEQGLNVLMQGSTKLKQSLPPRSYLAIIDQGLDISPGVPNTTEDGSFHVVRGTW
jgi:hypothetical protein